MSVNKLKLKRSAVSGRIPTTSSLDLGELALNTFDGKVFLKKDNGSESIIELASTSGSILSASFASFAASSSYAATSSYSDGLEGITIGHIPYLSASQKLADSAMFQVDNGLDQGYSIAINQNGVDTNNPEALYVYQASTSSFNVISGKGNLNNYLQLNIQNLNAGTSASSDIVATANNGNETSNYIDMGINGGNFNGFLGGPNDAYIYSTGNNLHIGNASANKHLGFFVGGGDVNSDNKFQLNSNNQHSMTGSLSVSGSLVASSNVTASNILVTNNLDVTNTLTARTLVVQTVSSSIIYSSGSNTFGNNANNNQIFTGSVLIKGAITVSGSVINTLTSSFAVSASRAISSSFATSASQALTASYVLASGVVGLNLSQIVSGSVTASVDPAYGFRVNSNTTLSGSAIVTGSLSVTGSFGISGSTGALFTANVDTLILTGSLIISGSSIMSGSLDVTGGITGSVFGTASYANNSDLLDGLNSTQFVQTGSFQNYTSSINSYTASNNAIVANFQSATASLNAFSASILNYTASTNATIADILVETASLNRAIASLYDFSASILLATASLNDFSASILNFTASTTANSSSFNSRIDALETFSSSLDATFATDADLNALSSSFIAYTASINAKTGSFATTGSNQFNGNQTITGSLIQGLEGNIATGENSHAEGSITKAIGNYSHAEGDNTQAKGDYSHAEGQETIASGSYSHAEGYQTIALANHQHVQGQYNAVSSVLSAFIVGNGTDDSNRSNLIHAAGNQVEITGSLNVNGGITGSLLGTASYANNSTSSSYAVSASYANIQYVSNSLENALNQIEVLDYDSNTAVTFVDGRLKFIFGTPASPSSVAASITGFATDRFNQVTDNYTVNGSWSNGGYTLISASFYEGTTLLAQVGTGTSISYNTTTSGSHTYKLEYTASSPLDATLYRISTTTTGTLSKTNPGSPTISPTTVIQLGTTSNQIEQGATGSITFTSASGASNSWVFNYIGTTVPSPIAVTGSATGSTSIAVTATSYYSSSGVNGSDNVPALTTTTSATTTYTKIRSLRYGASVTSSYTAAQLETLSLWDTTLGGSVGTIAKGTTTASGQSVTITWTGDKYHYIVYNSSLANLTNITAAGFGVLSAFTLTTVGSYKVYRTNVLQAGGAGTSITYVLT